MSDVTASRLVNGFVTIVRGAAVPELPALSFARARVVSQGIDGRVSLQMIDRGGERPDTLPVHLWCGTPGVSADVTPRQECVLAFASADASDPVAFLASPKGQPGHVPITVRHEATTEIRIVGDSAGIVRIGPGTTQKVALAPPVDAILTALQVFAGAAKLSTTDPTLVEAATQLETTLLAVTGIAAQRLESI